MCPRSKIKQLIHRAQENYRKNTQKTTFLSEQIEGGEEPKEILGVVAREDNYILSNLYINLKLLTRK